MAEATGTPTAGPPAPPMKNLLAGAGLIGLALVAKIGGPILILNTDLSPRMKTILTAVMFVVVAKVCLFGAVYVLGKDGLAFLKWKLFGWLAPLAPARDVGASRYTLGLFMFTLPLVSGWALPYLPRLAERHHQWTWLEDGIFVASFFVLGGAFWDKIRGLFSRAAVVEFDAPTTSRAGFWTAMFAFGQAALVVLALAMLAGIAGGPGGRILFMAELLILVPVIVAGQAVFERLRGWIATSAPAPIGRTQHRVGLLMFALPILFGLVEPYIGDSIPGYAENRVPVNLAIDFVLLVGLFVLGGEFWNKLRALYVRRAVVTPRDAASAT